MKVYGRDIYPEGSQPARFNEDSKPEDEPSMTNTLFRSKEFEGATMNRHGTVIDRSGRLASLEFTNWIRDEAAKAGWHLVQSENRDEGLVYQPPVKK